MDKYISKTLFYKYIMIHSVLINSKTKEKAPLNKQIRLGSEKWTKADECCYSHSF